MSEIAAKEVAESAALWIWCNSPEAEPFREICRRLGGRVGEEVARFDAQVQRDRSELRARREAEARARIARGPRHPDAELRHQVYERDGYACCRCGATEPLTTDHIVPWGKGGRTEYENLQTLCQPCNLRKGDR